MYSLLEYNSINNACIFIRKTELYYSNMIWITGFQFRYADVRWPMYTGKKFKKVFKNRKKWNRRNDTIYGKYISGRGTPRLQKIIEISITF